MPYHYEDSRQVTPEATNQERATVALSAGSSSRLLLQAQELMQSKNRHGLLKLAKHFC